jgi:hypothetical protein
MEFKDLKVIWDTQNEEPLFAVNQQGLKTVIDKKAKAYRKFIVWQEAQSYISSAFVIGLIVLALIGYFSGVLERLEGVEMTAWDATGLFVGMACWAFFGVRVFMNRVSLRRRERTVAKNLLEEIEQDIDEVESEIAWRTLPVMLKAFIPPYTGVLLFTWVVFRASGLPGWSIIPFCCVLMGGLIVETSSQHKLVPGKLLPRKRELESLRRKLLETRSG